MIRSRGASLSLPQARRVALAAQGFADPPHAATTMRTLARTIGRTGVLQVDSVNVFARAHLMPLYSRMGPYDPALLTRANTGRDRLVVEYWAHVQALMPVDLWPFMRHRMEDYRARRDAGGVGTDSDLIPQVLAAVAASGPLTARDLEREFGAVRTREHWGWNWSRARKALDDLYLAGEVAIAGRNRSFEVVYDMTERVLPPAVLAVPTPTRAEADRELVARAARSLGVATLASLADYYRMSATATRAAVGDLVEDGVIVPVEVRGWTRPAYLHADARIPRQIRNRTLLSPFDPVLWHRERAEALYDFHYRIEIYTPAHRRVHGYYVLPFLCGDRMTARVDLKADRQRGILMVLGAYAEPCAGPETAEELYAELRRAAQWMGLGSVEVAQRGDLASALGALSVADGSGR